MEDQDGFDAGQAEVERVRRQVIAVRDRIRTINQLDHIVEEVQD